MVLRIKKVKSFWIIVNYKSLKLENKEDRKMDKSTSLEQDVKKHFVFHKYKDKNILETNCSF